MAAINIALAGVGNCASALVQGIHYYSRIENCQESIGLRNLFLGGFHPRDIKIVAAFDIDSRKVGKDLSEAIFAPPNNAPKILNPPPSGVIVQKAPVLDGVGEYTRNVIQISDSTEVDVAEVLKKAVRKLW